MAVLIDTLKAAEIMEAAGFTEQQAKAVIEAFAPASGELATKADLLQTKADLKHEFTKLEQRMMTRIYGAQVATVLALIAVLSFSGHV